MYVSFWLNGRKFWVAGFEADGFVYQTTDPRQARRLDKGEIVAAVENLVVAVEPERIVLDSPEIPVETLDFLGS